MAVFEDLQKEFTLISAYYASHEYSLADDEEVVVDLKDRINSSMGEFAPEEQVTANEWVSALDKIVLGYTEGLNRNIDDMVSRYNALATPLLGQPFIGAMAVDKIIEMKEEFQAAMEKIPEDRKPEVDSMITYLDMFLNRAENQSDNFDQDVANRIEEIYDRMIRRLEYWARFEEANEQRPAEMIARQGDFIPLIISDWRPFGTGGFVPSVIMATRAYAVINRERTWVGETLGAALRESTLFTFVLHDDKSLYRATTRVGIIDPSLTWTEVSRKLQDIENNVVTMQEARLLESAQGLMKFETLFDEYFRFLNETQFVNQVIYGWVFFRGLSALANWLQGPFRRLVFPKLYNRSALMAKANDYKKFVINGLQRSVGGAGDDLLGVARSAMKGALSPDDLIIFNNIAEEVYYYSADYWTTQIYSATGITSRLPGVNFPEEILPGKGMVPPKHIQALRNQLIDEGVLMSLDEFFGITRMEELVTVPNLRRLDDVINLPSGDPIGTIPMDFYTPAPGKTIVRPTDQLVYVDPIGTIPMDFYEVGLSPTKVLRSTEMASSSVFTDILHEVVENGIESLFQQEAIMTSIGERLFSVNNWKMPFPGFFDDAAMQVTHEFPNVAENMRNLGDKIKQIANISIAPESINKIGNTVAALAFAPVIGSAAYQVLFKGFEIGTVEEGGSALAHGVSDGFEEMLYDVYQGHIENEVSLEMEDIINSVLGGAMMDQLMADIEQKINNNMYGSKAEIDLDIQNGVADHQAEIDAEITARAERIAEEMPDELHQQLAKEALAGRDSAESLAWVRKATSLFIGIFDAEGIGVMTTLLEQLRGMSGTAPAEEITLDGEVVVPQTVLDNLLEQASPYVADRVKEDNGQT